MKYTTKVYEEKNPIYNPSNHKNTIKTGYIIIMPEELKPLNNTIREKPFYIEKLNILENLIISRVL